MSQQHVVVALTDQVHDALRRRIAAVLPDHADADPLVRTSDHADLHPAERALALAQADDLRVITSAATLVEVVHPRLKRPALEWTLSRIVVEPVTETIARRAAALLGDAGLHGHRHAIDAMLSATALGSPGPVTILTSDPEDLKVLCGPAVTVIKV